MEAIKIEKPAFKNEAERKIWELEQQLAKLTSENAKLSASRRTGFKAGSANARAATYIKVNGLGDYEGIEQPRIKLQDLVRQLLVEDFKAHEVDGRFELQPATVCHQLRSHYKKMGWKVEQDAEVEA